MGKKKKWFRNTIIGILAVVLIVAVQLYTEQRKAQRKSEYIEQTKNFLFEGQILGAVYYSHYEGILQKGNFPWGNFEKKQGFDYFGSKQALILNCAAQLSDSTTHLDREVINLIAQASGITDSLLFIAMKIDQDVFYLRIKDGLPIFPGDRYICFAKEGDIKLRPFYKQLEIGTMARIPGLDNLRKFTRIAAVYFYLHGEKIPNIDV